MIKHHTKNKGDLGVLKAKLDLHQKGYLILNPETEHAPFDLVAYKEGKFVRIQVKYRRLVKGRLEIRMSTCWSDKHGTHKRPYCKEDLDLFCVYCPDTDKCYYFKSDKANACITIRVNSPKNKQTSGINMASDYEDF